MLKRHENVRYSECPGTKEVIIWTKKKKRKPLRRNGEKSVFRRCPPCRNVRQWMFHRAHGIRLSRPVRGQAGSGTLEQRRKRLPSNKSVSPVQRSLSSKKKKPRLRRERANRENGPLPREKNYLFDVVVVFNGSSSIRALTRVTYTGQPAAVKCVLIVPTPKTCVKLMIHIFGICLPPLPRLLRNRHRPPIDSHTTASNGFRPCTISLSEHVIWDQLPHWSVIDLPRTRPCGLITDSELRRNAFRIFNDNTWDRQ
jgi:hypothetical protein